MQTSDDPLQVAFTPALLEALDDRIARKVDETLVELLAIHDELEPEQIEAVA